MDIIDILQKVIDYIEENLKTELSSEELADMAGFSSYHFLHVFGSVVGMPLSAYTTKRRIKHAIYEVYCGKKLIDAGLLYGFDTHAGFFKDFKHVMAQWNCPLPDEFYENYITNFSKLYDKLPRHIIHRNPNPTNILFSNNEVSGFIDFDISQRNVRLFDPCYCATGILSDASEITDSYEKWPEILHRKMLLWIWENSDKLIFE